MNIQYQDGLGNPINVGDKVIYATCSGSSSAEFQRGVVELVDPVLFDANGKPEKYASQTRPRYGSYSLSYPTRWERQPSTGRWGHTELPEWMYRVKLHRMNANWQPEGDKLTLIHNVDRLVVVTVLV